MLSHLTENVELWQQGITNTLTLTLLAFIVAFFVAIPLSMARLSQHSAINRAAYGYVYLFRGTPLLVQMFMLYYGLGEFNKELKQLGLWWFFRDAYFCGLLAFILNSTAYQAEILRGGIAAVPKGVQEAGAALGLSKLQIFRKLILPIAFARMLPAMGNELVLLLKASALISIITVPDIMGQARYLYSETFDLSVFYIAAVNYLFIVLAIEAIWKRLEIRHQWLTYSGTR
ncbi:ABC transporter permease [Aliamphritea hakodatensis]|uniref:ABC transporter permease n=1 Tax=Aliamphritea hakodatensis TaxID=2895352 RepID=UPI0022FD9627|nr:ABC transporter permease subunit [Aliamphritea hakodatensis]